MGGHVVERVSIGEKCASSKDPRCSVAPLPAVTWRLRHVAEGWERTSNVSLGAFL